MIGVAKMFSFERNIRTISYLAQRVSWVSLFLYCEIYPIITIFHNALSSKVFSVSPIQILC